jgi:hypothetical protein
VVAWAVYGSQRLCVVAVSTLVVCVIVGLARVAHDTDPKMRKKVSGVAAQKASRACA